MTFISIIITFSAIGNEFRLDSTLRVYDQIYLSNFLHLIFPGYHERWDTLGSKGAVKINSLTKGNNRIFDKALNILMRFVVNMERWNGSSVD